MCKLPILIVLFIGLLAAACAPAGQAAVLPAAQRKAPAVVTASAVMPEPLPSATTEPLLKPTQTAVVEASPTAAPRLCSPLAGIALPEIKTLVSNPFHPPKPGSDEPHQGVDLAIRQPGTQMALAGNPVEAALPGAIAMVTHDRFPFGNAVIIETPLDGNMLEGWPAVIPTSAPPVEIHTALTCPAAPAPKTVDSSRRSLYILYAHLQEPAVVSVEDSVSCGQPIGTVGQSGNALNPHLHFEVKVGPASLRFTSMAHYDASATLEEMSNYCLWSISSLLQLVDPLAILQPEQAH